MLYRLSYGRHKRNAPICNYTEGLGGVEIRSCDVRGIGASI